MNGFDLADFVQAPARQRAALDVTDHRPWALPEGRWMVGQTWDDLLFAHWRVPAEALRALLPAGVELDLFEGEAWIGVVPFQVTGSRLRGLPPAPVISSFLELNARTYVTAGGKPGVWFFSLDASSDLAFIGARFMYKLPYFRARMRAQWSGGWLSYEARRRDGGVKPAAFKGRYRPIGDPAVADRRSLAYFLTERYCLYTTNFKGQRRRAEIHHLPWLLQPAEAEIDENTFPPGGVELLDADPLLHFSARQDVLVWPLSDA
jgi:uncharacterized protein YqjF (DUF2071 family)